MRLRMDVETAVALALVVALAFAAVTVGRTRFDPVDLFIVGLGLWPVVAVAGVVLLMWLAPTGAADGLGSRLARIGRRLLVLVPALILTVGAVAFNWRVVSCSMADQDACPHVPYSDIHFPQNDGIISDPYSLEFREPRLPAGIQAHPDYPLDEADWVVKYVTWGDGTEWAACRRQSDGSIACDILY